MAGDGDARLQRVIESILDSIGSGEWKPGAAVPSEPQLAARYGVSQSTIARATFLLRFLGFLTGPPGGTTRVSGAPALTFAWAALAAARQARGHNSQT